MVDDIMTTKNCSKCKNEIDINNFGKLKNSVDGYRYDCKLCRKEYQKINKNIIKEKQKEYLPKRKNDIKEKRKLDINFQISEILRSKIHKMIKGYKSSYESFIGCDLYFLKKWIEYRFDTIMKWDNLGTYWQIDHIIPINAFNFNNNNEIHICFHWTNLQPLTCYENRCKSNKILLHYYFNNIISIHRFNSKYKNFMGYQIINESLLWLRSKLRYGKNPPDYTMDNSQPSL